MKTILAPIDFSDVSDPVVVAAVDFAKSVAGRLVLVNVIEPVMPVSGDYLPPTVILNATEMTDAADKSAGRRLNRIAEKARENGLPVETIHRIGAPGPTIIDIAAELSADCIVLGSHGHSALYDLVVGSVAHTVLKRSKCPVLVIPAEKRVKPLKQQPKAMTDATGLGNRKATRPRSAGRPG